MGIFARLTGFRASAGEPKLREPVFSESSSRIQDGRAFGGSSPCGGAKLRLLIEDI
jgi:hypothetical protein